MPCGVVTPLDLKDLKALKALKDFKDLIDFIDLINPHSYLLVHSYL